MTAQTESTVGYFNVGNVKDWHRPNNDDCPHNFNIESNCTCKRPVKRKPYRVVRVVDQNVKYNVNPKIVIEVWPNGVLTFREAKRRRKYHTTTADIYSTLVWNAATKEANERKAARKAAKKAAKLARKSK